MLLKIALTIFGVWAVGNVLIGSAYLLTNEFMPYHAAAIQTSWAGLHANYQGLFLGFLKFSGAGNLVVGLATALMVILSFRHSVQPYRVLLPVVSLGYSLLATYAVYTVYTLTPGAPPLLLVLAGAVFTAVASVMLWFGSKSGNQT